MHWPLKAEIVLGTRVAETILASGHVRPHKQAAHMIASDPIKPLLSHLARRRPSTYVFSQIHTIEPMENQRRAEARYEIQNLGMRLSAHTTSHGRKRCQ